MTDHDDDLDPEYDPPDVDVIRTYFVQAHSTCDGQVMPAGWLVSENSQWIPGCYDTQATALRATRYPDTVLRDLGRIYRFDGENRPVTMADFDQFDRDYLASLSGHHGPG